MVNRNLFILDEIPQFHPSSSKYIEFWREQKKLCIEGMWQSGYWMPGQLYFYVNFNTILLNKSINSKVKKPGRPFLRDLEWEFFYNWVEARGFSGFVLDEETTCHRLAEPKAWKTITDFERASLKRHTPFMFKADGSLKKYEHARTYLKKRHPRCMGLPLYDNQSKDFMMLGSRGFGKTYSVAGLVLHEWLFDGMTKYVPLGQLSNDDIPSINLTVGAGDSKYSDNLLGKVKYALGTLPGSQEVGGLVHPSPLSKQYTGSWNCGDAKGVRALYKKKIGGRWQDFGTQSSIKHRSFADNPFAANGLRCTMMIFEEIGMFSNLIASRNASVECCMDGANKFGTMMFLGTGGDMDKGTVDANIMFNDPDSFDLISFDDIWENNGKISYFVPAYKGLNQFKDDNGFTLKEPATDYLQRHRKKLRASKSGGSAIDEELQNRPLVPSEAFLTKKGNIFPIDELRQRLVKLRANDGFSYLEKCVELYFDSDVPSGVNYKLDMENELRPLNSFPLTEQQSKNREGCVVVYDFPITVEGSVPKDMYIIGHDPYATDDPDGDSLGAVYVLKSPKHPTYGGNEVVASFIGRPHQGRRIINEAIYKLSMFYGNAKIYFENVRGNVKEYFEKVKRLDLLAKQPTMVFNKKASYESTSKAIIYGYPMSGKAMKAEGIQYIRDWLLEERGELDGKIVRNLDMIPDKGLLQELIAFNYGGNFDRVMAFMGCIVGLEERFNRYMAPVTTKKEKYNFLTKNTNLFEERSNELEPFTF